MMIDVILRDVNGHWYIADPSYLDEFDWHKINTLPYRYYSANLTSLAESVDRFRSAYPVSGEINFSFETERHMRDAMEDVQQTLYALGNHPCIEMPVDGLSVRFHTGFRPPAANGRGQGNWRFNLRKSNTEPLLRLNVESIGSEELLIEQTMRVSEKIQNLGGSRETRFRWEKK